MKKKKRIIIITLVVIITIILLLVCIKVKDNVTFKLIEENMVIDFGSTYSDPGFIAKNGFGMDISSNVTITNQVNTYEIGNYEIKYELNYGNVKQELYRTVTVDILDINKLNIVLIGEETLYLLKDSKYNEEGAYVVNSVNNEKFSLGTMLIDDDIEINKVGTYNVSYTYTYNGQSISKTRKVEVFDIPYSITPSSLTTKNVKISLNLESVNNYSNTKLPDGKTSLNKSVEYSVKDNGNYSFTITTKDNKKYEKIISINNIIDDYKCNGTITISGTRIIVTPNNDKVKGYEWVINNKTTKGTSVYSEYKIVNNAKVNLLFENDEKYQVSCLIEDKLLYHFKYDLANTGTWTKPEMQCNTYSAADRTKLETKLKQAINAVGGKGTRAGVVEAARFLVGGLDYRVRYLGPKKTDYQLGRYPREGLNIGNNKAWGCRVSGYIQGMDCTHFIEWVLYQNDIKQAPYTFPKTETSEVIDKIKPGDLLYVKCGKNCSNPSAGLTHVAIVVGVDKDIYYLAESVPGTDGKLGVTLHANKRSTVLSAYKLVGNIPFKGEGNVTDMWLME